MWVMDDWSVDSGCHELSENFSLYGLKHHRVEISGDVTDAGRTNKQTNKRQVKIGLLSF